MEPLAHSTTETISISGVAVPGWADAHVHVSALGGLLDGLNLRGLTKEDILERVADATRSTPEGEWIAGSGWDEGFFNPPVFPTASDLDAVSPNHPVVLERIDGHSSWVNSLVLKSAAISRNTPDPAGGRIVRNASKDATASLSTARRTWSLASGRVASRRQTANAVSVRARPVHALGSDECPRCRNRSRDDRDLQEAPRRRELPVRVYAMARGAKR